MRVNPFLALLMLSAVAFAGCTDDGGDDAHDDECADAADHDACHDDGGTNGHDDECEDAADHEACHDEDGGETNETPNAPPVPVLTITDEEGNELGNTSFVMEGANLTFSAAGTTDPDGDETLALGGLLVVDKENARGRSATLITDGATTDVTLQFTKEGPVTAVLSALDDRGASATAVVQTYVNALQTSSHELVGANPAVEATACSGPSEGLIDNQYSVSSDFGTSNGTRWIEASVDSSDVSIAICDPEGEAISEAGQEVSTDELEIAPGVNYSVFAVAQAPNTSFNIEVIVHWEPKPAE